MFLKKQSTGWKGEEIACIFLKNKGFSIIERNFRKPWGEIDIIAEKDNMIHFIEVKATKQDSYKNKDLYDAEERITPQKRKKLARIIQTYLMANNQNDMDFFVDVCAVYIGEKGTRVRFIEDISLL